MNREELYRLRSCFPETPGILGKDEFFNSAVLIPLIELDNHFHLLFEKRAANIRQGGEICFPGGEFDRAIDTSFEDTALRETEEEIGIKRDSIEVIGCMDTLIGPRGITVDSCVGILNIHSLNEINIDKKEVEKIFSVPVSYFRNNKPENYKIVSENSLRFFNSNGIEENLIPIKSNGPDDKRDTTYTFTTRNVLVYKINGEVIWGITARLVYELVKKINSLS
ncbi:MAG: CoA pyrophosphatase [Melioribacteraceae bacterium]|nr:CoA pyrophosphatase [Melioribacteraceae bacterium]